MTKNALNKTIIEGRAVRVPELLKTKSGIPYCRLIIAVNEQYYAAGQAQRNTSYITVAIWNKTASACCAYLTKGQKVRIVGSLRQSVWTSDSGMKKSKLEITCENIEFLDRPRKKYENSSKHTNAAAVADVWASSHVGSEYKECGAAEEISTADIQEI